jgi:hypothetical protein
MMGVRHDTDSAKALHPGLEGEQYWSAPSVGQPRRHLREDEALLEARGRADDAVGAKTATRRKEYRTLYQHFGLGGWRCST